jgi:hypothetical protein
MVADTAGLRETADEVEKIGIERARKACVLSARFTINFPRTILLKPGVCLYIYAPQRPSRRCLASRTRVPRRRHLHDNAAALGPTARNPRGTCPTREPTHVHPAQQNGSTPDIRAGACSACHRAPTAGLGGQSRVTACWHG